MSLLCYFPFAVAVILSRFCLCHVLPYPKARITYIALNKQLLHNEVSIQRRRKPCYGRNSRSKAYLVTLAKIQDTSAREVARSHSSCILSFDLIGQKSKQKILRHGNRFAARVCRRYFRRERSDDRKCVCCSQANAKAISKGS